jgi:hypothetical protein
MRNATPGLLLGKTHIMTRRRNAAPLLPQNVISKESESKEPDDIMATVFVTTGRCANQRATAGGFVH